MQVEVCVFFQMRCYTNTKPVKFLGLSAEQDKEKQWGWEEVHCITWSNIWMIHEWSRYISITVKKLIIGSFTFLFSAWCLSIKKFYILLNNPNNQKNYVWIKWISFQLCLQGIFEVIQIPDCERNQVKITNMAFRPWCKPSLI